MVARILRSALFVAISGILLPVSIPLVSAWGDEAHMIIATIAKLRLPKEAVAKIEAILEKWNDDFPGVGEMHTAAVWLDHVQCHDNIVYCKGFKHLDDIQLMRLHHYGDYIFNPQNIAIEGIYQYYPLPQRCADWALKTIYKSLIGTGGPPSPQPSTSEAEDVTSEYPNPTFKRGSPFSLNLHLRMLLHIFGDIHQPLHSGSLFAKGFPRGDAGGNAITIHDPPHISHLHHLWDSAGLSLRTPFFLASWDMLVDKAHQFMEEFPPESMEARLSGGLGGLDFAAILKESSDMALGTAYAEFNWDTFPENAIPYKPSAEYIERVQKISRQQITLAGYRLTNVLLEIEKNLPNPDTSSPNLGGLNLFGPLFDWLSKLSTAKTSAEL